MKNVAWRMAGAKVRRVVRPVRTDSQPVFARCKSAGLGSCSARGQSELENLGVRCARPGVQAGVGCEARMARAVTRAERSPGVLDGGAAPARQLANQLDQPWDPWQEDDKLAQGARRGEVALIRESRSSLQPAAGRSNQPTTRRPVPDTAVQARCPTGTSSTGSAETPIGQQGAGGRRGRWRRAEQTAASLASRTFLSQAVPVRAGEPVHRVLSSAAVQPPASGLP